MKKVLFILIAITTTILIQAREPYGEYIARYIVTNTGNTVYPIYNPLKITHTGIQAKNTNAGTKVWMTTYQGTFSYIYKGQKIKMHNFYFTKQNIEFSISDCSIVSYNGKQYYLINFDSQWQLAEVLY